MYGLIDLSLYKTLKVYLSCLSLSLAEAEDKQTDKKKKSLYLMELVLLFPFNPYVCVFDFSIFLLFSFFIFYLKLDLI